MTQHPPLIHPAFGLLLRRLGDKPPQNQEGGFCFPKEAFHRNGENQNKEINLRQRLRGKQGLTGLHPESEKRGRGRQPSERGPHASYALRWAASARVPLSGPGLAANQRRGTKCDLF